MKTVIGSSIRVTNPTDELMKWATDHLVIPNPEYIKKTRMHFWTGNTPKLLYMYETHGDELILPFGVRLVNTDGTLNNNNANNANGLAPDCEIVRFE